MPLGALNHIGLSVTDLDRSERFYDPLMAFMGYSRMPATPGQRKWKKRGVGIFLIYEARPESRTKVHDRYAPGLHHLCFDAETREEVDRLHGVMVAAGARILDAPAEYAYTPGYYAVFFADPDGLKLELCHAPAAYQGVPG